ncbi:uncharacterized protein LOC126672620 [Mercurialis annua]|uniref:uncharacterized protein LOC126672620 n=1 Tax=Mercurialis annua TaxID=3986 RepID=UPI00215E63D9|nr:uncharacterized protein LOC126672620 [Mercurialis annua]
METNLVDKLKETVNSLRSWEGRSGQNYKKRLDSLRKTVGAAQSRNDAHGTQNFMSLSKEYHDLLRDEEVYWKQRSKSFWLAGGDSNTRYFHNYASARQGTNHINRLRDEKGDWQSKKHEIDGIILRYFNELFSDSSSPNIDFIEVSSCVSQIDNDCMLSPISNFEVRKAVFSMHNDKSPGPDGFNPAFYKSNWGVVGGDLVKLCRDLFANAYEIGHYLRCKRRGKFGMAALKIDMSKAYDRVSIGECIGTGPIIPSRGLRFKSLLSHEEKLGKLHGAVICRDAPTISHLFFADDCFLFFRASVEEMLVVKNVLDFYENFSGQKVNFHKSNIIFSANVDRECKESICSVMEVVKDSDSGKYLGLPSLVGRNKNQIFAFIKDRVWNKVKGWNSKFLSRGGKEVLIKTVAQSMPNYVMNVFLIKNVCLIRFGGVEIKRRRKKFSGMGFKRVRDFNIAMLARQAWRFLSMENNLIVKVFKAKYFPETSFLEASLRSNPSYVWRSLFECKSVMEKGA